MSIRVSHAYGDHIAVAAADGTEILRYVLGPRPGRRLSGGSAMVIERESKWPHWQGN
ncbi:hypothetical protein [Streptomyces sp. NPDC001401]|uniref:hypothetical protein n=1 Tax=Streptomyces sp. NPDC001401 TaxID=3364570 RepID=UPI003676EF70